MYGIEELIALAAEKRASDVHLIAGLPPKCRIDGRIETLTDGGLTREDCEEYGRQLAGNAADQIEAIGQLDFFFSSDCLLLSKSKVSAFAQLHASPNNSTDILMHKIIFFIIIYPSHTANLSALPV